MVRFAPGRTSPLPTLACLDISLLDQHPHPPPQNTKYRIAGPPQASQSCPPSPSPGRTGWRRADPSSSRSGFAPAHRRVFLTSVATSHVAGERAANTDRRPFILFPSRRPPGSRSSRSVPPIRLYVPSSLCCCACRVALLFGLTPGKRRSPFPSVGETLGKYRSPLAGLRGL